MSPMKKVFIFIILLVAVFFSTLTTHYIYKWIIPYYAQEPVKTSLFSEDCVFYRKIIGGDMVISEPNAGAYRYEVYATSEGIEVWKCNNF